MDLKEYHTDLLTRTGERLTERMAAITVAATTGDVEMFANAVAVTGSTFAAFIAAATGLACVSEEQKS